MVRDRPPALRAGLTVAVGLLVMMPTVAASATPPDIIAVSTNDQTIDPGETKNYDLIAEGVDASATASFSGDGLSASITRVRGTRVRLSVTADPSAPAGLRDVTITNPDGLADTLPDAIAVTGEADASVGNVAGRVFGDVDGNGVEGGGEAGMAGVDVTVTGADGGKVTAATDAQGDFVAVGVVVGEAMVAVDRPVGFAVTTGNETQAVTVVEGVTAHATPVGYAAASLSLPGIYVAEDVHLLLDARSLDLSDGEAVTSWTGDLAGIEFVVPGSSDAPTLNASAGFGGRPSVEFDGVDDVLEAGFAELNTDDFVFQLVLETVTYHHRSAIVTSRGGASLATKNLIGYDDYDEDRTLKGEPSWVTMSGPNGTQAEHFHPILSLAAGDDRNSPTADPSGDANRVVITYVVRDSGQVRFWDRLDDLMDKTMSASGNDLAEGLRLGGREDGTSHANFRLAYLIVVDEADYSESDLLLAAADLGAWFAVPGFSGS